MVKGQKHSEETRKKMKANHWTRRPDAPKVQEKLLRNRRSTKGRKRGPMSEEAKTKMRETLARRNVGKNVRKKALKNRPPIGTPCALCRRTDSQLLWDHDHKTGQFRGWLCSRCNVGLGQFRDDQLLLEAASRYVADGMLKGREW